MVLSWRFMSTDNIMLKGSLIKGTCTVHILRLHLSGLIVQHLQELKGVAKEYAIEVHVLLVSE